MQTSLRHDLESCAVSPPSLSLMHRAMVEIRGFDSEERKDSLM